MLKNFVCFCGLLFLFGCTATQSLESPASIESHSANENEQAMECRRIKVTGSRLPQKRCATKQQWKEMTEQSQRELERLQSEQKRLIDADRVNDQNE